MVRHTSGSLLGAFVAVSHREILGSLAFSLIGRKLIRLLNLKYKIYYRFRNLFQKLIVEIYTVQIMKLQNWRLCYAYLLDWKRLDWMWLG